MKIFIPIKKVSERVPNKNFRIFDKVPLYQYVINRLEDKFNIYIDTDSGEIQKYRFTSLKIITYERRPWLTGHSMEVNKLIQYFLGHFIDNPDEIIIQMHVTTPFLKQKTIDDAIQHFKMLSKGQSLIACNIIQARLWRQDFRTMHDYSVSIPINHNPNMLEQTQNLNNIYQDNSCFYIFTKRIFMETKTRTGINPQFYPVGFPENLDIDTEEDWELCLKLKELGY